MSASASRDLWAIAGVAHLAKAIHAAVEIETTDTLHACTHGADFDLSPTAQKAALATNQSNWRDRSRYRTVHCRVHFVVTLDAHLDMFHWLMQGVLMVLPGAFLEERRLHPSVMFAARVLIQ